MDYRILLFDLDDTLLDFRANEAAALKTLFQRHGYVFSEEVAQVYHSVNNALWEAYENSTVTLEQVLRTRFAETMRRLGREVDGAAWEKEYRALLGNGSQLIEGATEVCQRLSETHRLFVITNGVRETQLKRLTSAGLLEFFEDIFDSQSIGFQKPRIEFFNHVMEHIRDFSKKETLIIGDSLSTDIRGGLLAGIDTCWVCRNPERCRGDNPSTYTIGDIRELFDILKL